MESSISVFDWVANLSPWWWVAFGIGLGAVEMATMSFFLIGPALAALIMALVVGVAGPLSGGLLVSGWAVLSVALTFVGRSYFSRFGDGGGTPDAPLNSRAERLVGRKARVIAWDGREGDVEVEGTRWRAVSQFDTDFIADAQVEVISAEGMTLTVADHTRG